MKNSTCRLEIKETGKRTVTVTLYIDGSNYTSNPRDIDVKNPLSEEDKKDLQWYLEEFLDLATGGNLVRAEKIEKRMKEWGGAIFEQVFIKHPDYDKDPRSLYLEAVERQLRNVEIAIDCRDPYLLSIPWELMRDKKRGFISLKSAGFYRQETSSKELPSERPVVTGRAFRILLVISRPKIDDVPLSMVAGPMLKAIRNKRDVIEVDLLRPPTFDNLQRRLKEKPDYYDLVHFDGHGGFAAEETDARGTQRFQVEAEKGVLLFEKKDHTPHYVSTTELADELYGAGVPLFILNACESAKGSDIDPYSSIAANLVKCGARGVVAMSYSVLAVTASYFMERFYERLISGSTLCKSVRDARCRLDAEPFRSPAIGEMVELDDWIIPVVYQQEEGYVPVKSVKKKAEEKAVPISTLIIDIAEELCLEGKHGFVGRDNDILDIERELTDDDKPWLLISGMSGSGKTDLAYGFARWYSATGGCPAGIFRTDFKSRADLGQIFGSIAGFGTDFSRLSDEDQFDAIVRYLKGNRCMLVIDNIENASGYPEKHDPFATQEQLKEMSRFFKALRGGKSRVILTTRKTKEDWLGVAANRKKIGGLDIHGSLLMAESILGTVGKKTTDFIEDHENFEELLRLLKGHPRSLEVVIPLLETKRPVDIIEALRNGIGEMEDISMNIAFENLSGNARKYLPLAGLFSSWMVLPDLKNMITIQPKELPSMKEIFRDDLNEAEMERAFDEAARAGLIDKYSKYLFGLHPTFPGFLRKQLISVIGEDGLSNVDRIYMLFYGKWSESIFEGSEKKDPDVMTAISLELHNLLRAARIAEGREKWEMLEWIARIIIIFYGARGHYIERGSFRGGLIKNIGDQLSEEDPSEKTCLQLFLLGNKVNDLMSRGELDGAEKISNRVMNFVEGKRGERFERNLPISYNRLGMIAEEMHKYDEAERWYHKAIDIYKRLGLESQISDCYHQLGNVSYNRHRYYEAEIWYRKALEIKERLGLEYSAAITYHQLGMIEQERHRYDEAEEWYRKSIEIYERLDIETYAAGTYHQLGIIEQERYRYDEAEMWYRKTLEIEERLGLETEAATDYHQLGNVSFDRYRYDESEAWYQKALEIKERLGLEAEAATDYHQLGRIAEVCHRYNEADVLYRRALRINERLGLIADAANEYHQMGNVSYNMQRYTVAKRLYKKAIAIFKKYGMDFERATSYHQLGIIAEERHRYGEAKKWYRKSLEIKERLGLEADVAIDYHQLGMVEQERHRYDEAEEWYRKAIEIFKKINHPPLMVNTLAQYGRLKNEIGDIKGSISFLIKALSIAVEHKMDVTIRILLDVAQIMRDIGEEEFIGIWKEVTDGSEPPMEILREVLAKLEESEKGK